ncbi:DMSO/TMAO reductase YedYZ molybdopterin-dependent catalytic subunit [Haloactinopolyspora alba]|uniref:DMSO/TMAO reductase YedYZ molybdopterin-dependent catalytic subunit n=1 Tax=Haloactinopolyspora alba TaxID=648780 RepID=A0A2P8DZ13_9ACTN|nr:molybdopterin-dependent oxidoreductase [Haloactinopolyspora alba]PSL02464.1 DMSO/TMAO reductase YedYZ molybdopterin-dependent catalytic subunit [Haloactinopolyspora alba]
MRGQSHRRRSRATAAVAGLVAGGATLGVGELAAGAVDRSAAPFLAVGNAAVDLTPEWLKSWAVSTFGEDDKLVLLGGMGAVLALFSLIGGMLELWRRWYGVAALVALGAVAAVAALNRPTAEPSWAVPTVSGVAAGAAMLVVLVDRLRVPERVADTGESATQFRRRRRQFLLLTTAAAGLAVVAAVGGRRLGGSRDDVLAARERLRFPAPTEPKARVPSGVTLDVEGITGFRTPNPDFYRVDTRLDVPAIRPDDWRLRIHGMVEREVELDFDNVLALGLVERMITLTCVSNEVGGELAGNAVWLGYPTAALLERAGPSPDADMVLSSSVDGFTISTPLTALTDGRGALLAVGMNGEPLPLEHGFPARLVVPGLYGYVSATKWVVDLEVTRFDRATAYWTDRGWAERAPIKIASRIDVPGSFAKLPTGRNVVAGVAWAQRRGISRVEVQVDDGPWQRAELAAEASVDVWRQWYWPWDADEPGNHTLRVRATDGDGELQTDEQAPPFPEGSSGWHSVVVTVN